jgi:late competence protein required for DNA uptake (superfamily II DNA/RNA helicase)
VIFHGHQFREPQHINWKNNFKIIMDAVEDYARRWIKREVDQDPEIIFFIKVKASNELSIATHVFIFHLTGF